MAVAKGRVRSGWELFDNSSGPWISGKTEAYVHDHVVMDADVNGLYAKHYDTGVEIRWADVCAEPWPGSGPPEWTPYGAPPEDWPYGNGC